MKRCGFILLFLLVGSLKVFSQHISSLEKYIDAVLSKGYAVQIAEYDKAVSAFEYQLFKSGLRPQISLSAFIPTFTRTSISVIQPSGSINFQPIYQNNASLMLNVEQPIMLTGGILFIQTALDRFDDIGQKATFYNGIPIRIGYRQSLVGLNLLKWNKRIADQQYSLSKQQYRFDQAQARLQAVNHYFDALIAEANYAIADSNRVVNETLLVIAEERLALGKISYDEKLQMEAEYKQSILSLAQLENAFLQSKIRMENLLEESSSISSGLLVPEVFALGLRSEAAYIESAIANVPTIQRMFLEVQNQKRNAAQLKAQLSPSFEIFTALGFANNGSRIEDVYNRPFSEQQVRLGINVPLVDWGRKRAAINMTQRQIERTELDTQQQLAVISNVIRQYFLLLKELQSRLVLQAELVEISERRYRISTERYASGVVLLTELVFAQRIKDQAIRDYLSSLREYYVAFFELMALVNE